MERLRGAPSLAASPRFWRVIAGAMLLALAVLAIGQSSVVIDGRRWFWIDDDQLISMRYARNLAEGHGLVWNAGERVEGYSNFLWVLVMAGVHVFCDDRTAPLVVILVNVVLALMLLGAAERLLVQFVPEPLVERPALLLSLALSLDVLFWCVNGFETTLLTLCFVVAIAGSLRRAPHRPTAPALIALALLPLIRADGLHLWLAAALVPVGLAAGAGGGRRARLVAIAPIVATLLPACAHVVFRHAITAPGCRTPTLSRSRACPGSSCSACATSIDASRRTPCRSWRAWRLLSSCATRARGCSSRQEAWSARTSSRSGGTISRTVVSSPPWFLCSSCSPSPRPAGPAAPRWRRPGRFSPLWSSRG